MNPQTWTYFVVLFWFFFFNYIILKNKKLQFHTSLVWSSLLFFNYKVIASFANVYVHIKEYNSGDSIAYFSQSWRFFDLIFTDFNRFLTVFFSPNTGFYPESQLQDVYIMPLYWTNNGAYFICRLNTLLHFVSAHNMLVHSLFFCFISYLGCLGIYRFFKHYFPDQNMPMMLACGLLPSIAYWGGAIHKESLVLFLMGAILHLLVTKKKYTAIQFYTLNFILFSIFSYIRLHYLVLFLIPLLLGVFGATTRYKFMIVTLLSYVFIFVLSLILFPCFDTSIFKEVVKMQAEFFRNGGFTPLIDAAIPDDWVSVVSFLPKSIYFVFCKPLLSDCHKLTRYISAVENIIMLLIFAFFIFRSQLKRWNFVSISVLSYCITMFVFLGYVVPYYAPLTRYKSIPMLFFLLVLIATSKPFNLLKIENENEK